MKNLNQRKLSFRDFYEDDEKKDGKHYAKPYQVAALGIATVIGAEMYGWNLSLYAGVGTYIIAQVLMAFAYIVLLLCIAEIGSAIQFSGGGYGLARVVLGFYPGFVIGCLEFIEYVAYTSAAAVFMSSIIISVLNISTIYQHVMWFSLYGIILLLVIPYNGKFMWYAVSFLVLSVSLLIIINFFAIAKDYNFTQNAVLDDDYYQQHNVWFTNFETFLVTFPSTTWPYGGVESVALVVNEMRDPKHTFHYSAIVAVVVLFVLNMLMLFSWASQPPSVAVTAALAFPTNAGFQSVFGVSELMAPILIIPGQFAMQLGLTLPYGQLLQSLAASNLLPPILRLHDQENCHLAIVYGTVFGYCICVAGIFYINLSATLTNICIICGFFTYFSTLIGYVMLKTKYAGVERAFESPFGITGAAFAFVIFALGFISTIGYQPDRYVAAKVFAVLMATITVYYFLYARHRQVLSKEEQKSVFKLHVINFNLRMQDSIFRKKKHQIQRDEIAYVVDSFKACYQWIVDHSCLRWLIGPLSSISKIVPNGTGKDHHGGEDIVDFRATLTRSRSRSRSTTVIQVKSRIPTTIQAARQTPSTPNSAAHVKTFSS